MPLSTATLSYDLSDKVGADFDARRTKVWVTTNVEVIHDTTGHKTRIGSGAGNINADGTGSAEVWIPGAGSNPSSWQTRLHVDVPDRRAPGGRKTLTFGPYTITGDAWLDELADEQDVPPTYLSTVTQQLDAKVAEAEVERAGAQAARAAAEQAKTEAQNLVISDLGTTDGQTRALIEAPGSQTAQALSASYDHSGAVHADTRPGASVAAKITDASVTAPERTGVVAIPSTLAESVDETAEPSDLIVGAGRLIVDFRNEKGTITNYAQKGAMQLTRVFGANDVVPPEPNSDNGSVFAVDALLTEGTGGNGTGTIHGENVAGYFGIQRAGESTRSAWGLNVLATTYAPPSDAYHTMGLEIDINNNGGVDAGPDGICDGLSIFTAGTSDARFGIWVTSARSDGAGDGTASRWLDGIHISGTASRAGLAIDAGSAAFDSENMIGIICQPPALFDDYVRVGRLMLTNAQYDALADYGAHVWRSTIPGQGEQTTGQLEANGKLTLQSWTADPPSVVAGGVEGANVDLRLRPKGTGALDLGGASTGSAGAVAEYLTVKINGVQRKIACLALS